ncbi:hypothetical protein [Zhihengliuella halotolerans]|uniref:hypothetical protein n=1 Tax=Zhihengliuella halotolerans TaxID=370736 RepID=UPI000C80EA87|nr:hypothetical protein [Zhihengliuella halotolerans]
MGSYARTATAAAVWVLAASLSACAGPASVADSEYAGVPPEVRDHWDTSRPQAEPVVFVDENGSAHLVTWGSSSCPLIPTEFDFDDDEWEFALGQDQTQPCTDDLAPMTYVFDDAPEPTPEIATVRDVRGERVQVDVVGP